MTQITREINKERLGEMLTKAVAIHEILHKRKRPNKAMIKVYTFRRWGNRYHKGYRFSWIITFEGASMGYWYDITLLRLEDLIQARQTMEKLGFESRTNPWLGPNVRQPRG